MQSPSPTAELADPDPLVTAIVRGLTRSSTPPHPDAADVRFSFTLADLVGVLMALLTLVLPLMAISQYSTGTVGNPSLILPVETAPSYGNPP